jgi:hypothetical protein
MTAMTQGAAGVSPAAVSAGQDARAPFLHRLSGLH